MEVLNSNNNKIKTILLNLKEKEKTDLKSIPEVICKNNVSRQSQILVKKIIAEDKIALIEKALTIISENERLLKKK